MTLHDSDAVGIERLAEEAFQQHGASRGVRDPAKYRPHRPHRPQGLCMGFLTVDTVAGYRPPTESIARVSTVEHPPGLLILRLLNDPRGRCGRCISESRCIVPLHVCFCRETPMCLASDQIHPYKDTGGRAARCRLRIYLPDQVRDAAVVICPELPNNPGGSITNSVEAIAPGVIRTNELHTPLIWIEHWPEESAEGLETFDLVAFSNYKVEETAPYLGETRAWIGEPTWKLLDHATVKILVSRKA